MQITKVGGKAFYDYHQDGLGKSTRVILMPFLLRMAKVAKDETALEHVTALAVLSICFTLTTDCVYKLTTDCVYKSLSEVFVSHRHL